MAIMKFPSVLVGVISCDFVDLTEVKGVRMAARKNPTAILIGGSLSYSILITFFAGLELELQSVTPFQAFL